MKVVIQTLLWKRLEISRIHFENIKETGFDVYVGVSEDWAEDLCKEYGFKYVRVENSPLGRKKNSAVNLALEYDWDYMMEMGSDDLLIHSRLQKYLKNCNKGYGCFGTRRLYFADTVRKQAIQFKYHITNSNQLVGAGRMIKREVAEVGLWDDNINKALDDNSRRKMVGAGYSYQTIECDPILCDFKTGENIWGFNRFAGSNVDYNEVLSFFPNQRKMLKAL